MKASVKAGYRPAISVHTCTNSVCCKQLDAQHTHPGGCSTPGTADGAVGGHQTIHPPLAFAAYNGSLLLTFERRVCIQRTPSQTENRSRRSTTYGAAAWHATLREAGDTGASPVGLAQPRAATACLCCIPKEDCIARAGLNGKRSVRACAVAAPAEGREGKLENTEHRPTRMGVRQACVVCFLARQQNARGQAREGN